jgi:UDP-glucose 4-epimerase
MKILITGGAGFIASNIVDEYIKNGHEVVIIDNLSSGKIENVNPEAKFYLCDIRSPLVEKIFEIEKPDIVNHHAAQISVPNSVANPVNDAEINVLGLLNILQNSVKQKVKKVIFISSGGAVYGEAEEYPTTENYSPIPLSPYAITKFVAEKYLYFYKVQFGLNFTILRYSNVFGPRQDPHGEAGVISIFINKLLRNERPKIYAYPDEPDGMIRDYIYVKDVVKANLFALEKGENDIVNIATKTEINTTLLFNTICKVMNKNVIPDKDAARKGDLKHSCLDNSKAKKVFGWSPEYSLEEGLKETCRFFSEKYSKQ